jgi:hypothetical protein
LTLSRQLDEAKEDKRFLAGQIPPMFDPEF